MLYLSSDEDKIKYSLALRNIDILNEKLKIFDLLNTNVKAIDFENIEKQELILIDFKNLN